jgi:hypothetical protein
MMLLINELGLKPGCACDPIARFSFVFYFTHRCREFCPNTEGTHATQGWSAPTLAAFLAYAGEQGAFTVTVWSDGLVSSRKSVNTTARAAAATCP